MDINLKFILFNLFFLFLGTFIILFSKNTNSRFIIFDKPDNIRKIHSKPTPLSGGIVLYLFITSALIFFYSLTIFSLKITGILIFLYTIFFILGFIDDKSSLSPIRKTLIVLFSLFVILPIDQDMIVKGLLFKDLNIFINLNQAAIFFTVLSIYFFYNLLNFSDGLNGITLSLCIVWTIIFLSNNNFNNYFLLSALICMLLVLLFNLMGVLFIGNSGSSFLSIFFSTLIIIDYNQTSILRCDEIFLLMFLPAYDSLRVSFERLVKGVSPFLPDTTHYHHLLMKIIDKKYIFIIYTILNFTPFILSKFIATYLSLIMGTVIYIYSLHILKKNN